MGTEAGSRDFPQNPPVSSLTFAKSYTYSVFNLVYETNVASCRIWDALGFKRIGRVKGCGNLNSYDEPVDAIIYGKELNEANFDDGLNEERFQRILYYLKHQKYPEGTDRAGKSRLRSAATHYRLVTEKGDDNSEVNRLFLKDREVILDPQKQYEIARRMHVMDHGGINKTTTRIANDFHWVRIKSTVQQVIKNCPECSDPVKNSIDEQEKAAHLGAAPQMAPPLLEVDQGLTLDLQQNPSQQTMVAPGSLDPADYQVPLDPSMMGTLDGYEQYMTPQPGTMIDANMQSDMERGVEDEDLIRHQLLGASYRGGN
jgi:hypothetical protein